MLNEWGELGRLEWIRQVLIDRYPEGLKNSELKRMLDVDKNGLENFLYKLSRYCFLYEDMDGGFVTYYVWPEMDERFERRILPYDRMQRGD